MFEEVTQENLYNFIPGKAARITTLLRRDRKMALKQALLTFYRSRAYRLLEHEETKLWHASPAQIYDEYLKPLRHTSRSYHNGPHHSKLAPYSTQIREWRDKGMTLREIVAELGKYGCRTTAQNLSLFLRNRHTPLA